mgnify:CR=1 FL=1
MRWSAEAEDLGGLVSIVLEVSSSCVGLVVRCRGGEALHD